MRLIRQHQFRQHVFVAADWARVLMFHDGAIVNIKRGHKDVLDMALS